MSPLKGLFARAFPGGERVGTPGHFTLDSDLARLTRSFNNGGAFTFLNAGVASREVWTMRGGRQNARRNSAGDVLLPSAKVPAEYFIAKRDLGKWKYPGRRSCALRGPQIPLRGRCDDLSGRADGPSRTIVTGEGGESSNSRFKHVVLTPRRALPPAYPC